MSRAPTIESAAPAVDQVSKSTKVQTSSKDVDNGSTETNAREHAERGCHSSTAELNQERPDENTTSPELDLTAKIEAGLMPLMTDDHMHGVHVATSSASNEVSGGAGMGHQVAELVIGQVCTHIHKIVRVL